MSYIMHKNMKLKQIRSTTSVLVLALSTFVGLIVGPTALAATQCGGVDTAIIGCSQDNGSSNVEDNGIWGLLLIALNVMTAGVGVLAVGGIVYGAILYTSAEDKADQVKKATDIITNVIIGLVAFALMWAGLNFLIPGGVFS
jgi:hypothetical protein